MKSIFRSEKGQNIESFHKPLKLRREENFSTLKQSYPDFEEIVKTQAEIEKSNQFKRINIVVFKN